MIKNYTNNIKTYMDFIFQDIFKENNNELNMLEWLIMYQNPSIYLITRSPEKIRAQMVASFRNCNLASGIDDSVFTDEQYAKYIYDYAQNKIATFIKRENASDYAILLYVYTTLTIPYQTKTGILSDGILNSIISDNIDDLKPVPIAKGTSRSIDENDGLNFIESIILSLY